MKLVEDVLASDHIATAKVISMIEDKSPQVSDIMKLIHPHTGNAHIIGFTGSPGVGKSSLVNRFVSIANKKEMKIGVLAIDGSSPISGGSILGDRLRIGDYSSQDNIFIRSMSTRGHLGGLAEAAKSAARVLDAFGCEMILIETVGVGQIELDIVHTADTVIICSMPGTGDYIQAMKAGIMEVADIFVINKSDLPGANQTQMEIEKVIDMKKKNYDWKPPVIQASATKGKGLQELWNAIKDHYAFLMQNHELEKRRKEHIETEIFDMVINSLKEEFLLENSLHTKENICELVEKIFSKEMEYYEARDLILNNIKQKIKKSLL